MSIETELIQQQVIGYNVDAKNESKTLYNNGSASNSSSLIRPDLKEATAGRRRNRKRNTSVKNKEQIEHLRITHITVERNRRKLMNHYLSLLCAIIPPTYVHRGDQASIVGGAINFVKELEQLLQSLEASKTINKQPISLLSHFYTQNENNNQSMAKQYSNVADVEVTMVESYANLKILLKTQPKQLLKMLSGFYSLSLTVLHINVTTFHHMVLYSFSVKVEDECQMSSVNEISAAVYEMMGRVQDQAAINI